MSAYSNLQPSPSVDLTIGDTYRIRRGRTSGRNNQSLRIERRMLDRDGERVSEPSAATRTCPHCGGRATEAGHPVRGDGMPVCLVAKASMRALGW